VAIREINKKSGNFVDRRRYPTEYLEVFYFFSIDIIHAANTATIARYQHSGR